MSIRGSYRQVELPITPVIGIAPHVCDNPIAICTEIRYINQAQICWRGKVSGQTAGGLMHFYQKPGSTGFRYKRLVLITPSAMCGHAAGHEMCACSLPLTLREFSSSRSNWDGRRHDHGLHGRCLYSHGRCCRIGHSRMCWLLPCGSIACTLGLVERKRKTMPSGKRLWIAVVMLLWFWSPSTIAMDPRRLQEHTGKPSARRVVTQEHTNTSHEPSPMLVAQGRQVPQANACACPAIICSELQRSEACHVSCARGRSAYCQCGSCNGIALSSPNYCGCR